MISVIIPVYKEKKIGSCLAPLLALEGLSDIIVVDGSELGCTISHVQNPRIQCVTSQKGRARQMNHGASLAAGSILLFLHADTLLPQNAILEINRLLSGTAKAGAFDLAIDNPKKRFRFIEKAANIRSRLTRIPFGDQAIFIKKDVFNEIGGFEDVPIMEDIMLMHQVKKKQVPIEISRLRVTTSPRRWEAEGVVARTLKNMWMQAAYYCGVSPKKLAKFYMLL